jgi:hypothetical protein
MESEAAMSPPPSFEGGELPDTCLQSTDSDQRARITKLKEEECSFGITNQRPLGHQISEPDVDRLFAMHQQYEMHWLGLVLSAEKCHSVSAKLTGQATPSA